jgi:hypothetical protein
VKQETLNPVEGQQLMVDGMAVLVVVVALDPLIVALSVNMVLSIGVLYSVDELGMLGHVLFAQQI